MKYLRLARLLIVDNLKAHLLIIVQFIAMFVIINLSIGSINSRSMLSDTYKSVLGKQGWYMCYDGDYDYTRLNDYVKQFPIEPKVERIYQAAGDTGDGHTANIYALPDEWFDDLTLAIKSSTFALDRFLVFANKAEIKAGDRIEFVFNQAEYSFKATDILTDQSYIPTFNSYNIDRDVTMLYKQVYPGTDVDEDVIVLTSISNAQNIGIKTSDMKPSDFAMVYYPEKVDEQVIKAINKQLQTDADKIIMTPISELNEKARKELKDDLRKYIPLSIIVLIVVILGTAGALAVQTLDEIKKYTVYYICGLKWNKMIFVSAAKVTLLLLTALLVSGSIITLLQSQSIAAEIGMVFNKHNLHYSLLLVILVLATSMILPFLIFKKNRPAEIIRRVKND